MQRPTLSTAEDRRRAVLDAGLSVFAASGYRGTPVAAVTSAAGTSPAYVFRLFSAKVDLFVATLRTCFDRILATLRDSVAELPAAGPEEVLAAMADAYAALITDRRLIMIQVHALAASDDPAIRDAPRDEQARLTDYAADRSRADGPRVQDFFARRQLCHLVAALGIEESAEPWARYLTEGLVHHTPPAAS